METFCKRRLLAGGEAKVRNIYFLQQRARKLSYIHKLFGGFERVDASRR